MANAQLRWRDQVITFPAIDDIEILARQRQVNRRLAFSSGGVQESALILPFDTVRTSIPDVVNDPFIDDLEAWWSHARRGKPYTFSFDDTDTVLTAIEFGAPACPYFKR